MTRTAFSPRAVHDKAPAVPPRRPDIQSRRNGVSHAVREALASPGEALDAATRAWIEPRLGHDFSRVRIHADERAAASATHLDAAAYTVGDDIVFGAGRYRPQSRAGKALIAHELAHVVQQTERGTDAHAATRVSKADENSERVADQSARAAMLPGAHAFAPAVHAALRASAPAHPTVFRAVKTWAGEFDTDKYDIVKTGAQEDGVDIELRFKPGDRVNASEIGMMQMVTSRDKGAVLALNPTVAARSIPAGKTGEGAHIDQLAKFRNPLYATGAAGAKDKLWDTPTHAVWGQHGYRTVNDKGVVSKRDAILKDTPQLPGRGANASQIFETTALAVTGVQTGAYYGSVRWGWRTDATGNFSRLPLTKISGDTPSGTFGMAAHIWNKTTDSGGTPVVKFDVAAGKYAKDVTPLVSDPEKALDTEVGKLDRNTRVEVIDRGRYRSFNKGGATWWKVTAVEGPLAGRVGWVPITALADRKS